MEFSKIGKQNVFPLSFKNSFRKNEINNIIVIDGNTAIKAFLDAYSKSPIAKVGLKPGISCRILNNTTVWSLSVFRSLEHATLEECDL